jgi:hypothetical protein
VKPDVWLALCVRQHQVHALSSPARRDRVQPADQPRDGLDVAVVLTVRALGVNESISAASASCLVGGATLLSLLFMPVMKG